MTGSLLVDQSVDITARRFDLAKFARFEIHYPHHDAVNGFKACLFQGRGTPLPGVATSGLVFWFNFVIGIFFFMCDVFGTEFSPLAFDIGYDSG